MKSDRKRGERGRSRTTLDLIDTCIKIIEPCQPITVRGVAYKLFVAGIIDSMAVKNTQKVSRILKDAREEGLIPWEWIVDDSRELERQPSWANLEEYARVVELSYRRDFWADQGFRVIVISEKSTVGGVLRPTLDSYGVPFFAAHGFNSATKVLELAEEIAEDSRHHVFLYVGDFDPSGLHMSEVDLPNRLKRYGADDFTFERIAVTSIDLAGLPSFSVTTKDEDPRFKWYVENYHPTLAWELDAMDPKHLRKRVHAAIVPYIDREMWERHKTIEEAQRKTTRMVAARLAEMESRA
jgi:hypothetical protein